MGHLAVHPEQETQVVGDSQRFTVTEQHVLSIAREDEDLSVHVTTPRC